MVPAKCARSVAVALALGWALAPQTASLAAPAGGFVCTEVIGYSQTREWFTTGFQSLAQAGAWQLRAVDGASVDQWASLDFPGWNNSNVTERCAQSASQPDRVVLDISDDYHTDVGWWVQQARLAIGNVRHNRPSVRQIVLQPVVGGPGGAQCPMNGKINRASFNHPYIDQAIDQLVGGDVVRGPDPTVSSCADYKDDIGHMTDAAATAVGQRIAAFYSGSAAPAPAPQPQPQPQPQAQPAPGPVSVPPPSANSGDGDQGDFCWLDAQPSFNGGFATLSQMLGDAMGAPMECEHGDPGSADTLQQTSTGLAFYRASSNTPTFTDGFDHWALTPDGLVTWTGPSVDPP